MWQKSKKEQLKALIKLLSQREKFKQDIEIR